jgi:tetratricopeptide (TPR) repeat protein
MIRVALATLVVALCASSAAAGIDPKADVLLKAGHGHFIAGRFSEALTDYQAAYKIDPDPDILFAIAQAERKLGQCHLALPHYREYLASRSDFPDAVKNGIAECWRQLPPAEGTKACPSAPAPREVGLPWYKNPASGAVIAGTVSAAVGIGFLFSSSSARDRADSAQFSDDFDALLDEATGKRRIGVTFLITGAILAGGGVAYHYWTKSRSSQPTTALATDGRSILFARSF